MENAVMGKVKIVTNLIASVMVVSGAARAQSPTHLYGATTQSYGPAAVTATAGTLENDRSGFMVAAFADNVGNLEVEAWQDTTKELNKVGQVHASGLPIVAVAAADLNSSEVVTADIDNEGDLTVSTWTVGTSGIAALNSSTSSGAATSLGFAPFLAMTSLSATEVVIAYCNPEGNLIVQAWNIPSGGQPEPVGTPTNGGPVAEIAIAAIDSETVITATNDTSDNLYVTTWGVDSTGVHQQGQTMASKSAGVLTPRVAIAAGTVYSFSVTTLPPEKVTRYAVTPIADASDNLEVLYWQISSSGTTITKTAEKLWGTGHDDITATAAVMLPSGVPVSVFSDSVYPVPGWPNNLDVGWVGHTGVSSSLEVSGMESGIDSVSAANAGDSFKVLDPYAAVSAYFVTGALYSADGLTPSVSNPGTSRVQVWSYPVVLPLL
jgi:hypothetical protein